MNEYLDDATPCTECGVEPVERIGRSHPIIICGVSLGGNYGTMLICPECKKRTNAYQNPQDAYREWNEALNTQQRRKGKC